MAALHAVSFTTPRPWSAAEFEDLLQNPQCFGIFESDGFLLGRAVAGEAEILTLAVDPAARGQGVGTRLLDRFFTIARARDAASAFLEVSAQNQAAISLYRKAGFAEVGRRKGYYSLQDFPAVDALVFGREL